MSEQDPTETLERIDIETEHEHLEASWIFFTDVWTQTGFKFSVTFRQGATETSISNMFTLLGQVHDAILGAGLMATPPPVQPRSQRTGEPKQTSEPASEPTPTNGNGQPKTATRPPTTSTQTVPGQGFAIVDDTSLQVSDRELKPAPDGRFYHRVGKIKVTIDPEKPDKPMVSFMSAEAKWKHPIANCLAWKVKQVIQTRYPSLGDEKFEFLNAPMVKPCKWILVLTESENKSKSGRPYKDIVDIIIPGIASEQPGAPEPTQ